VGCERRVIVDKFSSGGHPRRPGHFDPRRLSIVCTAQERDLRAPSRQQNHLLKIKIREYIEDELISQLTVDFILILVLLSLLSVHLSFDIKETVQVVRDLKS
jgi:hypothetical protein